MGRWDRGFADRYAAGGKPVTCDHCGHDGFSKRRAQLNTPGMTFLGLDWANRTATVLICGQCSRIHWFMESPQRQG